MVQNKLLRATSSKLSTESMDLYNGWKNTVIGATAAGVVAVGATATIMKANSALKVINANPSAATLFQRAVATAVSTTALLPKALLGVNEFMYAHPHLSGVAITTIGFYALSNYFENKRLENPHAPLSKSATEAKAALWKTGKTLLYYEAKLAAYVVALHFATNAVKVFALDDTAPQCAVDVAKKLSSTLTNLKNDQNTLLTQMQGN